jgi:hypothetical protein
MKSREHLSNERQLLIGALFPSLIVGALSIILASIFRGLSGAFGALLAQFVVVIYFLIRLFVSKLSRNLDPMSTMALALFSYTAKLFLLGFFLWGFSALTPRESIDRMSFGISAIALTAAWLGGEIASYLKLKTHLPLPPTANR